MPHAILAHVNDYAAQAGLNGIIAKLRKAIRIEIPIGYQDETGFHMGVKPAEKQVMWPPAGHDLERLTQDGTRTRIENSKVCGNNLLATPVGIDASAALKSFGVAREHSQ
jgi:hypothetical protein